MDLWTSRGLMEIPSSLPLLAQPYLEQYFPWHVLTRRQSFTVAAEQPLQRAASPPAPCGSWRKRALFRSTWIYVGEPEAAGDGNCRPSRLAVARGFWQGSKWTQWVTLSFPVSLPFYFFLPSFYPSLPSSTAPAFLRESLPPIGNRWVAQSLRWPCFALPIIKATHLTYIFTLLGLKHAF